MDFRCNNPVMKSINPVPAGFALLLSWFVTCAIAGCAGPSAKSAASASSGAVAVSDRVALDRVTGVAVADAVVHGVGSGAGYSAWVTLDVRLEQPESWRGRTLRLVSPEDFAVKAGDRLEIDLRKTTVSRQPDGSLEAPASGMRGITVLPK